jgi:hypothetical protein
MPFNVRIVFTDGHEEIEEDVTEIHYCYPSASNGQSIAFESDIRGTGRTIPVQLVREFETLERRNSKFAGEPDNKITRRTRRIMKTLLAGEDLVNNRLNCTLVDGAKAVNEGWRTQLDLTDEELRTVYNAIGKYLNV